MERNTETLYEIGLYIIANPIFRYEPDWLALAWGIGLVRDSEQL